MTDDRELFDPLLDDGTPRGSSRVLSDARRDVRVARHRRTAAIGAALVAVAVGIGVVVVERDDRTERIEVGSSVERSPDLYFESVQSLLGSLSFCAAPLRLSDYVGSVAVEWRGEPPPDLPDDWPNDIVVRGTVTAVEPGRAFREGAGDATEADRIEVGFDEPASWRTLHLTVAVTEQFGGESVGDEVRVGVTFYDAGDWRPMAESLLALTDAVFVLYDSPVFDYGERPLSIRHEGAFVGLVGRGEALSFPALDPVEEQEFLIGARTLSELRATADVNRKLVVERDHCSFAIDRQEP